MEQAPLISIVDDDDSVRVATAGLIRSAGYRANTFASAEEFLNSPDVIESSYLVIDVHMPKMGGLELCRALRSRGINTPVVFVTAFPDDAVRAFVQDDAPSSLQTKPLDCDFLIGYIASALKKDAQ